MRNPSSYLFSLVTSVLLAACSFGNTSGTPSPDAANHVPSCGDGICAASEVDSCPADCGTHAAPDAGTTGSMCGNGVCETGENSSNCPADCSGGGSDAGTGGPLNCSDPTVLEECVECLFTNVCTGVDVGGCTTCFEGLGGGGTCNMDGTCDIGEDITTCIDCVADTACDGDSPDGTCEADESNATCPADCPP